MHAEGRGESSCSTLDFTVLGLGSDVELLGAFAGFCGAHLAGGSLVVREKKNFPKRRDVSVFSHGAGLRSQKLNASMDPILVVFHWTRAGYAFLETNGELQALQAVLGSACVPER